MESVEVLHLVFSRLRAQDLASACCCCRLWQEVGSSEHLWRSLCRERWPGCEKAYGRETIRAMGGFRVFFTRRALTTMRKQLLLRPAKPWLRLDHLTFFVDLTYKGMPVVSEAIPGSVMEQACFGLRIDPGIVTEPMLPRQALTPLFYEGQLFYERPFQTLYASEYGLNWSAVRSTDHRVACLLHGAPLADGEPPREQGPPWGNGLAMPLVFEAELDTGAGSCDEACAQAMGGFVRAWSPMRSFACLECRPLWGGSLSQPMQFRLVQLQLGLLCRRPSRSLPPPPLDSVLLALQELDWK